MKVLSTRAVTADIHSATFLEAFVAAVKTHLGIQVKAAPVVSSSCRSYVYDWNDFTVEGKEEIAESLKKVYATCFLASEHGDADPDEDTLAEETAKLKTAVTALQGGDEFQVIVYGDTDQEFDIRITTNEAVISLLER